LDAERWSLSNPVYTSGVSSVSSWAVPSGLRSAVGNRVPGVAGDRGVADTASISFGILLAGERMVYLDDVSFEEVARTAETTENAKRLPAYPRN
jgi:hypothetical protein